MCVFIYVLLIFQDAFKNNVVLCFVFFLFFFDMFIGSIKNIICEGVLRNVNIKTECFSNACAYERRDINHSDICRCILTYISLVYCDFDLLDWNYVSIEWLFIQRGTSINK